MKLAKFTVTVSTPDDLTEEQLEALCDQLELLEDQTREFVEAAVASYVRTDTPVRVVVEVS